MPLRFYHFPASICSQKVSLVIAEKQLSPDMQLVDLAQLDQLSEEYLNINPNGVVPTLEHDGHIIRDSSVICEYLDEVFPEDTFSPIEPFRRAEMRTWLRFFEEVTTPAVRWPSIQNIFFPLLMQGGGRNLIDDMVRREPHHSHLYRKLGPDGFSEEVLAEAMDQLERTISRVDQALSDGRDYIVGRTATLADIVLLPLVVRMEDIRLSSLWRSRPHFRRWYGRMQERPSFDAVFSPGGVRVGALMAA